MSSVTPTSQTLPHDPQEEESDIKAGVRQAASNARSLTSVLLGSHYSTNDVDQLVSASFAKLCLTGQYAAVSHEVFARENAQTTQSLNQVKAVFQQTSLDFDALATPTTPQTLMAQSPL